MPAASPKRATVYFDSALHKALRLKAAETDRSVSDVVNEAVRVLLAEDADDLAALRDRADEPTVSFESFVRDLKAEGAI
ncbi:ribbon-helix-helix domain-containing protein [Rubrivirga marina]|uniref:CopG family transcriptional regulator n=1 Tax=Rubrivirga marina TaxID=1196024 RepID=A0A271J128_9BACT|nr:ribbon-helix-helix domain-containing protein [Rubrivirga marina]PAP77202.1 CopG family transcriptional regulator [Rubrivirga marina]